MLDPAVVLQQRSLLEGKPYKSAVLQQALNNGSADRAVAARIVAHFNALHDRSDAIRFADLTYLDAAHVFNLITLGRPEIYTSTYNGILEDFLSKLHHTQQTVTSAIAPKQYAQLSIFMEVASTYNRMTDVLAFIPADKLPGIIHGMGASVADSPNMYYSATMVNMLLALNGNGPMRHLLEGNVKQHYLHARNPNEKNRFGIIAATYAENSQEISSDMKSFFLGMASNATYHSTATSGMLKAELVDAHGVNNQLMVFPSDADGRGSFESWKAAYHNRPGWTIEEKPTYVHIHSTGGNVSVNIYANRPNHYDEGLKNIRIDVAKTQPKFGPSFQMFIGRGHSYHVDESLAQITPEMNLIALGSCGGHDDVDRVLRASPFAQLIVTQGMGSKSVNDPMLRHINESINKNGILNWSKEQTALDRNPSPAAKDYLLPQKDITMQMIRSFNKLQHEIPTPGYKTGYNLKIHDEISHGLIQARIRRTEEPTVGKT